MQRGDVDGLCKSPATLLLLSRCLCDNDSFQLHLFGHPGQASLWGDVDTSVVGRPRCDALWPRAAAHRCALASPAPGEEEGGVMAAGGGMAQWHPSLLPHDSGPGPQPALNAPAMDLLSPVRVLNLQSHADCVCPSRPAVVWWQ